MLFAVCCVWFVVCGVRRVAGCVLCVVCWLVFALRVVCYVVSCVVLCCLLCDYSSL